MRFNYQQRIGRAGRRGLACLWLSHSAVDEATTTTTSAPPADHVRSASPTVCGHAPASHNSASFDKGNSQARFSSLGLFDNSSDSVHGEFGTAKTGIKHRFKHLLEYSPRRQPLSWSAMVQQNGLEVARVCDVLLAYTDAALRSKRQALINYVTNDLVPR